MPPLWLPPAPTRPLPPDERLGFYRPPLRNSFIHTSGARSETTDQIRLAPPSETCGLPPTAATREVRPRRRNQTPWPRSQVMAEPSRERAGVVARSQEMRLAACKAVADVDAPSRCERDLPAVAGDSRIDLSRADAARDESRPARLEVAHVDVRRAVAVGGGQVRRNGLERDAARRVLDRAVDRGIRGIAIRLPAPASEAHPRELLAGAVVEEDVARAVRVAGHEVRGERVEGDVPDNAVVAGDRRRSRRCIRPGRDGHGLRAEDSTRSHSGAEG